MVGLPGVWTEVKRVETMDWKNWILKAWSDMQTNGYPLWIIAVRSNRKGWVICMDLYHLWQVIHGHRNNWSEWQTHFTIPGTTYRAGILALTKPGPRCRLYPWLEALDRTSVVPPPEYRILIVRLHGRWVGFVRAEDWIAAYTTYLQTTSAV